MSKKIIAIFAVATILFVCTFAACQKENNIYADDDDIDLVTDENGEKVLSDDGELLVYVTDDNGKYVTEQSGERVTLRQQFQPFEEDGVVEDYGFKITLPEGWKTTAEEFGVFSNEDKSLNCELTIVKYFYNDYYNLNYDMYQNLLDSGVEVSWEEDIDLGEKYKGVCRFSMKIDGNASVLYFFENSDNIYKLLFTGVDSDNVIADTEQFCKAMSFKPFTYYDDITEAAKEETTE